MRLDKKKQPKPPETIDFTQSTTCLKLIFITTGCLAVVLNLNFPKFSCIQSCLSLFFEWTAPTVELPAMVIVALHHDKTLCNLFIHAHIYHNRPQPKVSIKHASEALSGKKVENVAFRQNSLATYALSLCHSQLICANYIHLENKFTLYTEYLNHCQVNLVTHKKCQIASHETSAGHNLQEIRYHETMTITIF